MHGHIKLHAFRDEQKCSARNESGIQSRESVFVEIRCACELLSCEIGILLFFQRVRDVQNSNRLRQCFNRRKLRTIKAVNENQLAGLRFSISERLQLSGVECRRRVFPTSESWLKLRFRYRRNISVLPLFPVNRRKAQLLETRKSILAQTLNPGGAIRAVRFPQRTKCCGIGALLFQNLRYHDFQLTCGTAAAFCALPCALIQS